MVVVEGVRELLEKPVQSERSVSDTTVVARRSSRRRRREGICNTGSAPDQDAIVRAPRPDRAGRRQVHAELEDGVVKDVVDAHQSKNALGLLAGDLLLTRLEAGPDRQRCAAPSGERAVDAQEQPRARSWSPPANSMSMLSIAAQSDSPDSVPEKTIAPTGTVGGRAPPSARCAAGASAPRLTALLRPSRRRRGWPSEAVFPVESLLPSVPEDWRFARRELRPNRQRYRGIRLRGPV